MDVCPYCGEEQRALKNHVRLASGDGHGPSGSYPDDFEEASSGPSQDAQSDADTGQEDAVAEDTAMVSAEPPEADTPDHDDGNDDLPATTDDDTGEMSHDEVHTMLETAAAEGYEDGYTDAQEQTEPVEVESTVADLPAKPTCPSCGGATGAHKSDAKLVTQSGHILTTEAGDRYCEDCHTIVGNGETHKLAENPDPETLTGGDSIGKIVAAGLAGLAGLGVVGAMQSKNQGGGADPWDGV